jgi:hypothetical protein
MAWPNLLIAKRKRYNHSDTFIETTFHKLKTCIKHLKHKTFNKHKTQKIQQIHKTPTQNTKQAQTDHNHQAFLQRMKDHVAHSNRHHAARDIARNENILQSLRHLVQGGKYPSGRTAGPSFIEIARRQHFVLKALLLDHDSVPPPYAELHTPVEDVPYPQGRNLVRDSHGHPLKNPLPKEYGDTICYWSRTLTKKGTWPCFFQMRS